MKIQATLIEYGGSSRIERYAHKTKRPTFSDHRGRTWDIIGKLDDGTEILADTTWGFYGYFVVGGQWYKFPFSGY